MSFKITWDIPVITQHIHSMKREICSPYNDGYTQWMVKQDLYRLKWILDESLNNCPAFNGEEEWLKEQSQKKMWETLKSEK